MDFVCSKSKVRPCDVSPPGEGNSLVSNSFNGEKYIEILEQHSEASKWHLFYVEPGMFLKRQIPFCSAHERGDWTGLSAVQSLFWNVLQAWDAKFCCILLNKIRLIGQNLKHVGLIQSVMKKKILKTSSELWIKMITISCGWDSRFKTQQGLSFRLCGFECPMLAVGFLQVLQLPHTVQSCGCSVDWWLWMCVCVWPTHTHL